MSDERSVASGMLEEIEASGNPQAPTEDALAALQAMGKRVLTIDEQIAEYEERVRVRKETRHQILGRDMVELMDRTGVEFVGVDGWRFEAGDYCQASIKEENRDEAHDWLEANDAGDLIKNTVVVEFGKEDAEQAQELERYVRERYQSAEVERRRAVPWKRLTSWLKEQLALVKEVNAEGGSMEAPPLKLLGANVGRVVSVKAPKPPPKSRAKK